MDLDYENAESMMKMFVNLLAEVITQHEGVSKIHEELSKFFYAEYFEETFKRKIIHWLHCEVFRDVS
jgi:hypothetical protein